MHSQTRLKINPCSRELGKHLKVGNTERDVYMFLCFTLSTNQVKSTKNKLPKTQRLKCQKPKQCCFITYGQILMENATQKEFR